MKPSTARCLKIDRARATAPLLAVSLAVWLAGLAGCTVMAPVEIGDPTIPANDDPMAAAIRDARLSLPGFLATAASPPANTVGFRLRVSISDGSHREFVWIMPFRQLSENDFTGTVADRPAYLAQVVEGQELAFDRSAIVDWGYTANGHDIGSRTVCVMLQRMPREKADQLRRDHRMSC